MAEVGAVTEVAMAVDKIDMSMNDKDVNDKHAAAVSHQMSPGSSGDEFGGKVRPTSSNPYSPWFTIVCAGFALISDGYQNNLLTVNHGAYLASPGLIVIADQSTVRQALRKQEI